MDPHVVTYAECTSALMLSHLWNKLTHSERSSVWCSGVVIELFYLCVCCRKCTAVLPPHLSSLVWPLWYSVLDVPDVKRPPGYFLPVLPVSVNGKFIKPLQQGLLSPRGLLWNTSFSGKFSFPHNCGQGRLSCRWFRNPWGTQGYAFLFLFFGLFFFFFFTNRTCCSKIFISPIM